MWTQIRLLKPNSVDPDQTAPRGAIFQVSKFLQIFTIICTNRFCAVLKARSNS